MFETDEEDSDRLKKSIFFYHTNESPDKDKQRICRQKFEMVDGKSLITEGVYNRNGQRVGAERHASESTELDFIPAYIIAHLCSFCKEFKEIAIRLVLSCSILWFGKWGKVLGKFRFFDLYSHTYPTPTISTLPISSSKNMQKQHLMIFISLFSSMFVLMTILRHQRTYVSFYIEFNKTTAHRTTYFFLQYRSS